MCRHGDTGVLQLLNWLQACPGPQSALVLQPTRRTSWMHRHARGLEFTDHGTSCGTAIANTVSVARAVARPARHAPQPRISGV